MILSDDILVRCGERAQAYDRGNNFFDEDFTALREADYLHMDVPEEFGGLSMLAAAMARWDEAEHDFEDALDMKARMGARPWLAHTQHDYATMLPSPEPGR